MMDLRARRRGTSRRRGAVAWLRACLVCLVTLACAGAGSATPLRTLDTSGSHTCAIAAGGAVRCWGYNGHGEIGDRTTVTRLVPTPVIGLPDAAVEIATGGGFTCALLASNELWCWGDNARGQLGVGDFAPRPTPVRVGNVAGPIAHVTAAGYDACAVMVSGALLCWGANEFGQLGVGDRLDRATPVYPVGLTSGVIDVAMSSVHSCALDVDGAVQCWGYNLFGQVGDGTTVDRPTPTLVGGRAPALAVTARGWRTCALTATHDVECWGAVAQSVYGGALQISGSPVRIDVGRIKPERLVDGGNLQCVLDAAGAALCWGDNEYGQLGDGTRTPSMAPVRVALDEPVVEIVPSFQLACARVASGDVYCWGANGTGQLGTADLGNRSRPTLVALEYVLLPATVVEYYDASLDHYFITLITAETQALDQGRFAGWMRTGAGFRAWPVAAPGTSPVCRFYIPPAHGDSHFYSASPTECADIAARFPWFVREGSDVMHLALPDLVTGACAAGTLPVYRLWNARADTNHRYTTDPAVRTRMIARGYVSEGYGPSGVAMCAPQ